MTLTSIRLLTEKTQVVTSSDLKSLERYLDALFKRAGIADVEFTRHFLDRVNDRRNHKQITIEELRHLFEEAVKKFADVFRKAKVDWQAVIKDVGTDINVPFVIDLDPGGKALVAKTVMRKSNFQTSNKKLVVKSEAQIRISTKNPAAMTPSQVNKEMERLDKELSDITSKMSASGRGHEKFNDTVAKTDALSLRYRAAARRLHDLRQEIIARVGPSGRYGSMPRTAKKREALGEGYSYHKVQKRDIVRALTNHGMKEKGARNLMRRLGPSGIQKYLQANIMGKSPRIQRQWRMACELCGEHEAQQAPQVPAQSLDRELESTNETALKERASTLLELSSQELHDRLHLGTLGREV